jgi:hypothetical protein
MQIVEERLSLQGLGNDSGAMLDYTNNAVEGKA